MTKHLLITISVKGRDLPSVKLKRLTYIPLNKLSTKTFDLN